MDHQDDFDKFIEKLSSSKGSMKIKNYFLDLIVKEEFQEEVRTFRKKYKIPPEGFREKRSRIMFRGIHLAPRKWSYSKETTGSFWVPFLKEINEIGRKFKIPSNNTSILHEYIMFSEINPDGLQGFCETQDCFELGDNPEADAENLRSYPIAIRVSPYASKREILDYVAVAFTQHIKPLQERYKDKKARLGKAKTKKEITQKLYNFIYKHRNSPLLEIKQLLKNAGFRGYFSQPSIAKIISTEKKRRKV